MESVLSRGGGSQGRGATGRLQSLPQVAPHDEHLSSALRRIQRVNPPKTVKSKHKRQISSCAMKLDALTKELAVPLGKYVKGVSNSNEAPPLRPCPAPFDGGGGQVRQGAPEGGHGEKEAAAGWESERDEGG